MSTKLLVVLYVVQYVMEYDLITNITTTVHCTTGSTLLLGSTVAVVRRL